MAIGLWLAAGTVADWPGSSGGRESGATARSGTSSTIVLQPVLKPRILARRPAGRAPEASGISAHGSGGCLDNS